MLELIERFLAHLRYERNLSQHTVAGYRRDLDLFVTWIEPRAFAGWTAVDDAAVRAFIATRHRRGAAPRSLRRNLAAIRSFYAYLIGQGQARVNPARDVQTPKPPRRLPRTLDVDQMARLLKADAGAAMETRDLAIMELFYSSGLRLAELVGVNVDSFEDAASVRVTGKGNRERIVPVGRHAREAIAAWLAIRGDWAAADERALFVSRRGKRLGARAVQERVRQWALRQGTDARVYPHLFRHSFASHLLESSGNLRAVQEMLGHANISTTQIYTHLDFQHLARIYDQAHPRAKKARGR